MPDTQKIEITDNNELSLKEIRETFYHCRDFEITNLWQRSVFLFGFILACFTGYGAILISLLTTGEQKVAYPTLTNLIECVISLIGIVFSIIWIMMAKGSKAWYEIYENAITKIENKNNKQDNDNKDKKFLKMSYGYRMGNYCKQYKDYLDDSLFSTKGGRYSPSKLNIFIGQVLFVIWTMCLLCHSMVLLGMLFQWLEMFDDIFKTFYQCRYLWYVVFDVLICYILRLLYLFFLDHITSSVIEEE